MRGNDVTSETILPVFSMSRSCWRSGTASAATQEISGPSLGSFSVADFVFTPYGRPWRQLLPWPEAGGLSSPLSPPEPAARARFTRPRSSGSRRRRRRAPTSPGPLQRSASRTMRSLYSVVKLASLSFGRNLRVRKGRGARPVGDASALRACSISEESSACIPMGERFIQLHSSALYIKLNGSPCLTIIDTEGFAPPQEDHQQRVARR